MPHTTHTSFQSRQIKYTPDHRIHIQHTDEDEPSRLFIQRPIVQVIPVSLPSPAAVLLLLLSGGVVVVPADDVPLGGSLLYALRLGYVLPSLMVSSAYHGACDGTKTTSYR
eukprot:364746_1